MSDVYEAVYNGAPVARFEADGLREARGIAAKSIELRKLSAREVADLTQEGKAIQWKDAENAQG